jgi:3-(3-hydroxy-phenyl)propionate hydroxylase
VRRLLGLSFDGMTWQDRFVATNVYYNFERHGYARATFVIDDRFGAVIVILNNEGLWRCTYILMFTRSLEISPLLAGPRPGFGA